MGEIWTTVLWILFICVCVYIFTSRYRWFFGDLQDIWHIYLPTVLNGYKCKFLNSTTVDLWNNQLRKVPDKKFIQFHGISFNYREAEIEMNKIAWFARERLKLQQGDVVSVLMTNGPDFIWTFFGLMKVGVIPALINHNLRSGTLLHAIRSAESKFIVCGQEGSLRKALVEIQSDLLGTDHCEIWYHGADGYGKNMISVELGRCDAIPRAFSSGAGFASACCYIFTSGTTGLPKPAVVTHRKMILCPIAIVPFGFNSNDVLYSTLPMYHTSGVLAMIATITCGATLVFREKFSASKFWEDCVRNRVTVIHYIGEICRFLLLTPPSPFEMQHTVRMAVGNGIRADVWQEFQRRFGIEKIGEFYGATEGNIALLNITGKQLSVGRQSPLVQILLGTAFLRFDPNEHTAWRNPNGFCERIGNGTGEPGLFVCKIVEGRMDFDGYVGRKELTERKILRNVFVKGDRYFNTGDLFTLDQDYNVIFHDRVGDTFRWKGENVSTTEVSNVISSLPFINDACVFGVTVPGNEGRCGMAAITMATGALELTADQCGELVSHLQSSLPTYARPLFFRFLSEMDLTGTFKQRKGSLMKDGFNPSSVPKGLYFFNHRQNQLVPLGKAVFDDIVDGKLRL